MISIAPASLPFLAVVRRELLVQMRLKRTFAFLVLWVVFSLLVVVENWPQDGVRAHGDYTYLAEEIVGFILLSLVTAIALLVPSLASAAFAGEKEDNTYDLLILTLIWPSGLILAKLLSAVGLLLLMFLATLPALGSVFFLIGMSVGEVLYAFGIILLAALSCALISLYCSARCQRRVPAALASFLTIIILMGGWYLLLIPLDVFGWIDIDRDGEWVFVITCPPATCLLLYEGPRAYAVYGLAALYHALLALTAYASTLHILRRPLRLPKKPKGIPLDNRAALAARRKRFPYYLIDPLKPKKPIADGRNPLLVKELSWGLTLRGAVSIRIFYAAILVGLFVAIPVLYSYMPQISLATGEEALVSLFLIYTILILLAAPVFLGGVFAKDRHVGTVDMLRMTLLRPRSIVLGKLLGALVSLSPLVAASVLNALFALTFFKFSTQSLQGFFYGLTTLAVSLLIALSVCLFTSVMTKQSSTAMLTAYLLLTLIGIGLSLALILLYGLLDISWIFNTHRSNTIMALSPIVALALLVDNSRGYPYWASSMAAYTILSGLLIAFSAWRFTRRQPC